MCCILIVLVSLMLAFICLREVPQLFHACFCFSAHMLRLSAAEISCTGIMRCLIHAWVRKVTCLLC